MQVRRNLLLALLFTLFEALKASLQPTAEICALYEADVTTGLQMSGFRV